MLFVTGWLMGCAKQVEVVEPNPPPTEVEPVLLRIRIDEGSTYEVTRVGESRGVGGHHLTESVVHDTYHQARDGGMHSTQELLSFDVDGEPWRSPYGKAKSRDPEPTPRSLDERGGRGGQFLAVQLLSGEIPMPPEPIRPADRYTVAAGTHDPDSLDPASVRCLVDAVTPEEVAVTCEGTLKMMGGLATMDVRTEARISRADGHAGRRVTTQRTRIGGMAGERVETKTWTIRRLPSSDP